MSLIKYYDMTAEVTIQCDASEKGLGATLLQNGQPVAFASRTLKKDSASFKLKRNVWQLSFHTPSSVSTLQEKNLIQLKLTTNHCSPSSKSLC